MSKNILNTLLAVILTATVWTMVYLSPSSSTVHAQQTDTRLAELGHPDAHLYPVTITKGAAAGSDSTVVCATNYTCDDKYGVLTFTTGTVAGSGAGTYANVAFNQAWQSFLPSCVLTGSSVVGGTTTPVQTVFYGLVHEASAPALSYDIKAVSAPANSTVWTLAYHCGK